MSCNTTLWIINRYSRCICVAGCIFYTIGKWCWIPGESIFRGEGDRTVRVDCPVTFPWYGGRLTIWCNHSSRYRRGIDLYRARIRIIVIVIQYINSHWVTRCSCRIVIVGNEVFVRIIAIFTGICTCVSDHSHGGWVSPLSLIGIGKCDTCWHIGALIYCDSRIPCWDIGGIVVTIGICGHIVLSTCAVCNRDSGT